MGGRCRVLVRSGACHACVVCLTVLRAKLLEDGFARCGCWFAKVFSLFNCAWRCKLLPSRLASFDALLTSSLVDSSRA
jgi:hypothetical protein